MMFLANLIINIVALLVVAYIVPGFAFTDPSAIIVTAIIMGVVNTFIKPVLQIIALPISILTLGIFAFFINVTLLWFVSLVVPGFEINGFVTAAIASIALSLITAFLHKIAREK